MNEGKRLKGHREKKNYKGHKDYVDRKAARNEARPKQRFLGIDPETGIGRGWTRRDDIVVLMPQNIVVQVIS